jgi:hypothetical protein
MEERISLEWVIIISLTKLFDFNLINLPYTDEFPTNPGTQKEMNSAPG